MKMTKNNSQVPENWHKVLFLLTKSQVALITGYSIKHIEFLCAKGAFPAPVRLSENRNPRWSSLAVAKALGVS